MKTEIERALDRIKTYINKTPLIYAENLSTLVGTNVYLKLENLQKTKSFKLRGALNKLLLLKTNQNTNEVITASTGNHGAAVAYACQLLEITATVFAPKNAAPNKLEAIEKFGARLILKGMDCGETEEIAREYAKEKALPYISPYNDIDIVHGQGTIADEITDQIDHFDEIYVCIGGGGLISGISGYLKTSGIASKIIGCLPKNSPAMYESINAGKIISIQSEDTISDASAGNIDLDSITFDLCKKYVDDYELVSEKEIEHALYQYVNCERLIAEGSAGACLASVIKRKENIKGKTIIIVVSGANISLEKLIPILQREQK